MKTKTAALTAALLFILSLFALLALPACKAVAARPQVVQVPAYFATAKVIDNSSPGKRPARVAALRAATAELASAAAAGPITLAGVEAVLIRHLAADDELKILASMIIAWMPAGQADYADLARNAALGIAAALPAAATK